MKHLYSDIVIVLLGIIIGHVLLYNNMYIDFIIAALVGVALIVIQKENTSIRFIPRLAVGSILFSFGVLILHGAIFYLYNGDMETALMIGTSATSFTFLAISFISGLLAVVVRGFWSMRHN